MAGASNLTAIPGQGGTEQMLEYSASYPTHPTHASMQYMLANIYTYIYNLSWHKESKQNKKKPKPTNRRSTRTKKQSWKSQELNLLLKDINASLIPETPAAHLGRLWQQFLEQPHSTGHYSLCRQSALSRSWHFSWHLTPHSPQRMPCRAMPHSSPSHS